MNKELLERIEKKLDVFTELVMQTQSDVQALKEMLEYKRSKRVKKVIEQENSFEQWFTYVGGSPLLFFDNQVFSKMYGMYKSYCEQHYIEMITPNKFSRIVHGLGYETESRKVNKMTVRVFVKVTTQN